MSSILNAGTDFNVGHDQAFVDLCGRKAGQQWSSFDVPVDEAKKGRASKLVITIWNYHRDFDEDGKRVATEESAIVRDRHDGTLWYRVANPRLEASEKPRKTHVAHWKRLHLAFEQQIPIIGVLKDAHTNRCSLNHLFDCDNPRYSLDEKRMWLQLRPKGEVGCDVGEIDILAATRAPIDGWLPAEEGDTREAASDSYAAEEGDQRRIAWQQIKQRRGQQAFREALRNRYGDRCLVTRCTVLDVLEAAHIDPYRNNSHNDPENGLLLRADIHTLFDLNLLGIEPETLRIKLHPRIADFYQNDCGEVLGCLQSRRPSLDALKRRYEQFKKRYRGST